MGAHVRESRDFYVRDQYNDYWNEEPFPTFSQANQFRYGIRAQLPNRDLRITSVVRPYREKVHEREDRHG